MMLSLTRGYWKMRVVAGRAERVSGCGLVGVLVLDILANVGSPGKRGHDAQDASLARYPWPFFN